MSFVDAVAVLRRHKLLAVYGLLVACLLATFSAYRLDGTSLVSRTAPLYQSRAVVAVRPGAEQPTTTTVPPTTVPAPPPTVAQADGSATATPAPTTTVAVPPLAPLSAVIDSRAMYYTALSLKTIVVSPGFAEAVKARAPDDGRQRDRRRGPGHQHDGRRRRRLDARRSPPTTMSAALAELQSVVAAYSATPATRFGLDGVVISAPSAPAATSSIKEPLTFIVVLAVVLVLWWFLIRAVDALAQRPPPLEGGARLRASNRRTPRPRRRMLRRRPATASGASRRLPCGDRDASPHRCGAGGGRRHARRSRAARAPRRASSRRWC